MFFHQALETLQLKKPQNTDYVLSWKYTGFLHSTNPSEYKMGITFDRDSVFVEQNYYLTEIVNVYIIYDLDAWTRNPKNYLFVATNIVKNSDQETYVHFLFLQTIHFWPSPQKLFKLFLKIALKNCLAIV